MRTLKILFLILPFSLLADMDFLPLQEDTIDAIYKDAKRGDPQCQYIIGMLYEIGEIGFTKDIEKASEWYLSACAQGCMDAQIRLGLLYFFEEGAFQNKIRGMAMILAASAIVPLQCKKYDNLRRLMQISMPESDLEKAFNLAIEWMIIHSSQFNVQQSHFCVINKSTSKKDRIIPILDRWVPAEANERVYGPGTHDNNQGILRSDYEKMQQEIEEFVAKLGDLKNEIVSIQREKLLEKLEALKKEAENLKSDAIKSAAIAVLESMAAGLSIQVLPAAILSGLDAINNFKEAAESYCRSIDISREIEKLMELDKSREAAKELERENDRRGR